MSDNLKPPFWVFLLMITVSGFLSMVYQVIWERAIRYNFGGDSVSLAIVAASFLLGLGVGAYIFGRWYQRAFLIYAVIELGIGFYGIFSYEFLTTLAPFLGQVFTISVSEIENLRTPLIIGCVLFLMPPCILMGGGLPLMFNCFVKPGTYKNSVVGLMYGFNTLGGALGIWIVPFFLFWRMTLPLALGLTGLGNIILGIAFYLFGRKYFPQSSAPKIQEPKEKGVYLKNIFLLVLTFMTGFILISYEMSLFRAINVKNPSSPYNFSLVLMPFLISLAGGSILFTRFRQYDSAQSLKRIGILFFLSVSGMLAGITISSLLPGLKLYWHILLLVVPMPFLLGGVFPLLLRIFSRDGKKLPSTTGLLYLINSLGSFTGAFTVQFWGFSNLGTQYVVVSLFITGLILSCLCLISPINRLRRALIVSVAYCMLGFIPFWVPEDIYITYTLGKIYPKVDWVEGETGVASVEWGLKAGKILVNGQHMSSVPDDPGHVRLASYALVQQNRATALVLGLGGGGMVYRLIKDPKIRSLDVIDWSKELPKLLRLPKIRKMNEDVLNHPKVRLISGDARVAVSLYEDNQFDFVIDNLSLTVWAGATNVKSIEYFYELKRILKPSGVLIFRISNEWLFTRKAILAGMRKVFNFIAVKDNVELLASSQPIKFQRKLVNNFFKNTGSITKQAYSEYGNWLYGEFVVPTEHDLKGNDPIHDYNLYHEFNSNPFR